MKETLGIVSFVIGVAVTFPYMRDIVMGRAVPARSTRILFLVLLVTILIVQSRDFTSWILAFTVSQVVTQLLLFGLSMKYGVGGFSLLDIAMYVLFIISVSVYVLTDNTLIGLILLCITDFVAFVPTIVKTWNSPESETSLFFVGGAVSSLLAILAASQLNDINQILFPSYIIVADLTVVALIYRPYIIAKVRRNTRVKTLN